MNSNVSACHDVTESQSFHAKITEKVLLGFGIVVGGNYSRKIWSKPAFCCRRPVLIGFTIYMKRNLI